MTGYCVLVGDLNKCEYYIEACSGCNAPHKECGMFKEADFSGREKNGTLEYERKPRWYEEFYK